jgi:hypothetical protein
MVVRTFEQFLLCTLPVCSAAPTVFGGCAVCPHQVLYKAYDDGSLFHRSNSVFSLALTKQIAQTSPVKSKYSTAETGVEMSQFKNFKKLKLEIRNCQINLPHANPSIASTITTHTGLNWI